jgi:outer membrane biosynthesis protein TonB
MPRPLVFLLTLALGAGIAVALVSCGSDDEDGVIPPESASAMLAALEDAEGATDCGAIEAAAQTVANEAAGLPESEARTGAIEGAENLAALAREGEGCETGATGPEGPQPPEETTTEETTTEPTTTEETTTPEPEEEKPPKEPKPPPDEGDEGEDGGPPVTPPGQGGQPPGQTEGPPETGGTGSGSIGGEDD